MNGKLRLNWLASIAAALALTASVFAAPQGSSTDNSSLKSSNPHSYSSTDSKAKKVNVNTASKAELEALPGVGPSVADNIINARPFHTVNDLKSVSGIGDQRFQEIRPHVTVGSASDRKTSSASGAPGNASSAYASGSDKPGAEAQARSHTTSNSHGLSFGNSGDTLTTDTIHSGSDKPGARQKEETRSKSSSSRNTAASAGSAGVVTTDTVHSGSDKPGAREKEEARSSTSSSRDSASSTRNNGAKVNINTASKAQLEALPGIGPVKAQAIIDGRPYTAPEDIMKVNGIKEGTYDKIRDQITTR
jgi:competence protein ComEA